MERGYKDKYNNIFDKNDKDINVLGVISIIKVITIFLICLGVLKNIVEKMELSSKTFLYGMSQIYSIMLPLFFLIGYILWKYILIYMYKLKMSKGIDIAADVIYIVIVTVLILVTNSYESQYKFLYMFNIISATIRFGKNYGLTIAWVTSIIISLIDLFFRRDLTINIYFQNDLIMGAGFVLIAWILGEYVKSENKQREELKEELRRETKKHHYFEEILLNNEACYDLLIENSQEAIFIHNEERVLYANEHALKLFRVKSLSDLNTTQLNHEENKLILIYNERYSDIYSKIHNNKLSQVSFEDKFLDKDGNELIFLSTSALCSYEKKQAILTITRDITPKREVQKLRKDVENNIRLLEEMREYNKYITEFFSNVSHELKTPLNIISSSTQLLKSYYKKDISEIEFKKIKYIDSIYNNCNRLTRLINNLLDITKFDSGFITLQKSNRDIIGDVENIVMSIIPYAESKGIEVTFDTDLEVRIMAFDQDKVERIILNLISNALKFTNRGGNIFVSIMNTENHVLISVKDTGTGIPEDKKDLIFERFMQVDKTLRRNHEGTGIGLSIVKSFVELHGGKIEVISEINKGSEFIITLPFSIIDIDEDDLVNDKISNNIVEKVSLELSDI